MKLRPNLLSRLNAVRRQARAGFTMVEIALCLAIIGFALVAIIGVLPTGMSAQKDNREESVINLDATYLMDVLSTGARGQDDLTNSILTITNTFVLYDGNTNFVRVYQNHYTTTNYALFVAPGAGPTGNSNLLTSGSMIVGLLSTPKYIHLGGNQFYSNYTVADFRAMSSSFADQGTNQTAQDFSFHYRVVPEFIPYTAYDPSWTNNSPDFFATAINLRPNLSQMRLRFNWPVLPNGSLGNNRQVFRTMVSGSIQAINVPAGRSSVSNYFVLPHTFTSAP